MNRKFMSVIIAVFLLFGIASSAHALQHAYGYAGIDLNSFAYSGAFAGQRGVVSGAAAYAVGTNGSDFDYEETLNSWEEAYATGAWAESGITSDGYLTAAADASAGGANGQESAAFAASYAVAYDVYVPEEADFTIDYYLNGTTDGDTGYGYSSAGSGALLAVFDGCGDGQWLDIEGGFGTGDYQDQDILSLTLSQGFYTIFVGTAAFAYATETFTAGTGTTAPVPEPATMLLLGTGLLGLAGLGRKKQLK